VTDIDPPRNKRCYSESISPTGDAKTLQRCSLHTETLESSTLVLVGLLGGCVAYCIDHQDNIMSSVDD